MGKSERGSSQSDPQKPYESVEQPKDSKAKTFAINEKLFSIKEQSEI